MDLQDTLLRLKALAAASITQLEQDVLEEGENRSSPERERDARCLRTLVKVIEDIAGLEARLEQIADDDNDRRREFSAEQRNELARRIEALSQPNTKNSRRNRAGKL